MTTYLIPTQPNSQYFRVSLNGSVYQLKIIWRTDTWYMDINDSAGNSVLAGIPLITGASLLEQFAYLMLGGDLLVKSSGVDSDAMPTYDNLGSTANLYWVTP
ncbi:MAG: hypothetical protein H5T98_01015 [Syntrophomonadaceae bacterium]|nr:hypothetical protein [Syntrophomonadaceae bacterium]